MGTGVLFYSANPQMRDDNAKRARASACKMHSAI
jgi:hypothetical protein